MPLVPLSNHFIVIVFSTNVVSFSMVIIMGFSFNGDCLGFLFQWRMLLVPLLSMIATGSSFNGDCRWFLFEQ
jgi:hypothetical protein